VELADTIKEKEVIDDSSVTGYFESMVSDLGVEGQRAGQMQENQEKLVEQLEGQQEEIAGVSLDDEMGEMIKYQQAYNAASKIISTSDEMMDSLMSIIR
ncbi:MAG: flagellar basal body rod C-terminal domain-containing protein, partial [bacterium]